MISFFDHLLLAVCVGKPIWLLGGGWEYLKDTFFDTADTADDAVTAIAKAVAAVTTNGDAVILLRTEKLGVCCISMQHAQLADMAIKLMRGEVTDPIIKVDEDSMAESFRTLTGLSSREEALEILRAYEAQVMVATSISST